MAVFDWSRQWQYQVDTARDGAGRLIEHANKICDVAGSCPAAAGPGIRDFTILWYWYDGSRKGSRPNVLLVGDRSVAM